MKKSYTNPAVNTADVKIRVSLLAGSATGTTNQTGVNNNPVSGTPSNPIYAGAKVTNID
jgi:hypothetical protein